MKTEKFRTVPGKTTLLLKEELLVVPLGTASGLALESCAKQAVVARRANRTATS
jgi:hypothetical protein